MKRVKIFLVALNKPEGDRVFEPLGIECLAGHLNETFYGKVNVRLFLIRNERELEVFIKIMEAQKPDIIGLSLFFDTLDFLNKIIEIKRKMRKEPLVVLGNVLASYNCEHLLWKYPEVYICTGSGELSISGLTDYILGNKEISQVSNLAYIDNERITQTQRVVSPIASPDRVFLPIIQETKGRTYIETSRSCQYNCNFCGQKDFFGYPRIEKPVWQVVGEMKELLAAGYRNFDFVDEDLLGGSKERACQLAQEILFAKSKGQLPQEMTLMASLSVKSVLQQEKALDLLRQAGLSRCFLGVESGSSSQLKRYGKAHSLRDAAKALEILENLSIEPEIGFIMFDPEMKISELEQNIRFLRKLGIVEKLSNPFHQLRPMKDTKLATELSQKGLLGKYNPNWLFYEPRYRDEKVVLVMKKAKEFERLVIEIEATLKRAYRSNLFEFLPKEAREFICQNKGRLNVIFIDLLSDLVKETKNGKITSQVIKKHRAKLREFLNEMLRDGKGSFKYCENLKGQIKNAIGLMEKKGKVQPKFPFPQDNPRRIAL